MYYYYIALTECINTGEMDMAYKVFESLEEAKEWVKDNEANSHYRHHPYSKIIQINTNTNEATQLYFRTPRNGDWYELW